MTLSPAFRSQNALAAWSPDGEILATVTENLVQLRRVTDPNNPQVVPTCEKILQLAWAPDSERFLCLLADHTVRAFSVADRDWSCAINEGLLPVVAASWAPDSLHVLTLSDCGMRLSVWSLCETRAEDAATLVVMRPKSTSTSRAFSPSGKFWAVCTRCECKDYLEVFCISTRWTKLREFEVKTADLQGVLWTPSETSLVIWDSPPARFGVFSETAECGEARQSFFSVVGKPFAVHSRLLVYHVTGEVLFKFEPPAEPLGIRQLQMHAKVGLLIASGYDETIRVFSLLDWTEVFPPLHHREKMPIGPHVLVVREELNECQERSPTGISDRLESRETATWEARSRAPVVYRQLGPSQETRDGTDGSGEENQRPSEDWRPRRKNARMQGREETEAEGGKSEGERGKDAEPEEREKNDPRRNRDKKTPKPFIALPTEKIADVRLGSPERDRRGGPARPRLREAGSCGVAVAVPSPCGAFLASQHGESLAIATSESRFFLWTCRWQSVAELSRPFQCRKLLWSPGGDALLLQEKSRGVIAYPSFLYSVPETAHEGPAKT
uniref:WDR8 protein isoform 3 family protein n=1 Tax=Neospora caninum (strain Liverpool) TaxID=572307 RepID=A0A0F7UMJ6_NEOCL|nr:TPA: WDR8 protein isoform 3 family protein [Neospora caninum Liverpool]